MKNSGSTAGLTVDRMERFWDRRTPLKRVGVYVPGGKAVYPSSVLMNIVPAKVAGVEEIVMVTPPGPMERWRLIHWFAAREAGADVIYKVEAHRQSARLHMEREYSQGR